MELITSRLFKNTKLKRYPKRQILIYEGDSPDEIFYVVRGYVKVYSILGSGSERIVFIYGPGDIFPLTSYLSLSGAARYFYESMTDIEVNTLRSEYLNQKVRNDVALGEALIDYTWSIHQQFFQRIDQLSLENARNKVVALFVFLTAKFAPNHKDTVKLDLPLTAQAIADMCGLTRETAAAQIIYLKRMGVLDNHKKMVIHVPKLISLMEKLGISNYSL